MVTCSSYFKMAILWTIGIVMVTSHSADPYVNACTHTHTHTCTDSGS